MGQNRTAVELGEPDVKVAGFQLWVHGRQFAESEDYYDGNWLRVTAHCGAAGSSVWAQGAIVMVTDIATFCDGCVAMLERLRESAALAPCEPELKLTLEASDGLGHLRVLVEITPDHLKQAHRFEFEIDRSHLPGIIRQCSEVVQTYPIRGRQDGSNV